MSETNTRRITDFYGTEDSVRVMAGVRGWLGMARLRQELIAHLPFPPARVADIGGGCGVHAFWLAKRGYAVSLSDISSGQVDAIRNSHPDQKAELASADVADARQLPWPSDAFDAALLLGPLYHLLEFEERQAALLEARRVCRPGATLVIEGLSRLPALLRLIRDDPSNDRVQEADAVGVYEAGKYLSRAGQDSWFTESYYHAPGELADEAAIAGLEVVNQVALEGPFWLLPTLDSTEHDRSVAHRMVRLAEYVSRDVGALACSPHFIVVARLPE